ncbi:MAG TPA: transglycosylase SLT domain-containing protein [Terriglobia bacterium]|nr:transglycosylase SLT domain-containing protein [Terriglobia bacterium]
MAFLALLWFPPAFGGGAFWSEIDRAFESVRAGDADAAASALDRAAADNPELFAANNLHYLRGRLAEDRNEWDEARKQFAAVSRDNPLRPLAAWREARLAARAGDNAAVRELMAELPPNFPSGLKMEIAALGPSDLAVGIYQSLTLREARLKRAEILDDEPALWKLLRERGGDDVSLKAAQILDAVAASPKPEEAFDLAETFFTNREFDAASRLYRIAAAAKPAESRYQIARAFVLSDQCPAAIEEFAAIAKDFPNTSWQRDAEYQTANCYWRMNDFKNAGKAYETYINRYGGPARQEGATRNLVDVYRVQGENAKALSLIDRALAQNLSTLGRQVLQFARAKILLLNKRYGDATALFRQLARSRLSSGPGATTKEEARYFEALSLERGNLTAQAQAIYKELSANPRSYYGQKAMQRLTPAASALAPDPAFCDGGDAAAERAERDVMQLARPARTEPGPPAGALTELIFLRLWDDAALWTELNPQSDLKISASLAYLAERFNQTIRLGGRLPQADPQSLAFTYPAGFRSRVCQAASEARVDPQWLHSIIWQESKYDPQAKSGASARGLMQFIPETANAVASAANSPLASMDLLYDPAVSIPLGARYWAELMTDFKAPELALAAYNGGPENVRRWKMKSPDDEVELFVSDIGFTETKAYVLAVFSARAAYAGVR